MRVAGERTLLRDGSYFTVEPYESSRPAALLNREVRGVVVWGQVFAETKGHSTWTEIVDRVRESMMAHPARYLSARRRGA